MGMADHHVMRHGQYRFHVVAPMIAAGVSGGPKPALPFWLHRLAIVLRPVPQATRQLRATAGAYTTAPHSHAQVVCPPRHEHGTWSASTLHAVALTHPPPCERNFQVDIIVVKQSPALANLRCISTTVGSQTLCHLAI